MKTLFKIYRKIIFAALVLLLSTQFTQNTLYAADFSDVSSSHWAYEYVAKLKELNITNGVGNNKFGIGQTITKAEFVAFLCNILQLELTDVKIGSFADNQNIDEWYFPYIETALNNGIITLSNNQQGNVQQISTELSSKFYPKQSITREEIATMIVNALGYEELAKQITYISNPFTDVLDAKQKGYITIAKDLGIISGITENQFMPKSTATREQAATMLVRMYNILNNKVDFINGFYAINSSPQLQSIINFDSICFGWGRLELSDNLVSLNISTANNNEYYLPPGYEKPYNTADKKERFLMLAVDNTVALNILLNADLTRQTVNIIENLNDNFNINFDGIVIDFEGLKGEEAKQSFNAFLSLTKEKLNASAKKLYVAVHPQRREGHEYYNAYDYKTIGQLADKVILMAHDYNATSLTASEMEQGVVMTPVAPIEEVYYALRAITDKNTGVQDLNKIALQISFGTAQWKLKDGKVINQKPYTPSYDAIVKRIQSGVEVKYDKKYESPYITFYNNDDETNNVVWYEDERSINAKVKLTELFGIKSVSVWRIGTIPDYSNNYLNVLSYISNLH